MAAITVVAPTIMVTKRNEMCEHVSKNITVVLYHYSMFVVILTVSYKFFSELRYPDNFIDAMFLENSLAQ